MNDKDEIKELFQEKLGNYQAKVNPNLWNGIQAGIGSAGTAAGMGSSLGIIGKVVIGASIAAAITVGTLLIVNNDDKPSEKEQSVISLKAENATENKSREQLESKGESIKTLEDETVFIDKPSTTLDVQPTSISKKEINIESSLKEHIKKSNHNVNEGLVDQEVEVTQEQVESNISEQIKIENNTTDENTVLSPKKEKEASTLTEVYAEVVNQNNQYVSFTVKEVPNNAYVVWSFGDGFSDRTLNPEHFYTEAGTYNVKCRVKTDTEEVTKNINVEIKITGEIGNLPNVFTPNGDGNNDEFFIESKHIKNFQLTVIDNQQNIIFSTNDIDFRWDGTDKGGQAVKEGTYYYIIIAEDESGNTINKYQELRLHR